MMQRMIADERMAGRQREKYFTYTLTFQFYLSPVKLSGATSLRAKERQAEKEKSRQ